MGAVHPSRITPAAESGPGGAEAGGAPRNVCLMKRNRLLPMLFALLLLALRPAAAGAQQVDLSGCVRAAGSGEPVAQAVVELPVCGLWAVADSEGRFTLRRVPAGLQRFALSCLGYVAVQYDIEVGESTPELDLRMEEESLRLESVVVTATQEQEAVTTSRRIEGSAIDHLQMMNAADVAALLPGGKTVNPDLTQDLRFSLRDGGVSSGNAGFATAVEVDGLRLSTNSSFDGMAGAPTRNIASTSIEAVEVVTGVPSAEYGDLGSGLVRITTRKGLTPWMLLLSSNPHTKQIAASKGFDLGGERGVVNGSVEYTRATKNPVSPYTAYSRTGLSLSFRRTFAGVLRLDAGVTGNIGGLDTKDDPDAEMGEWQRARENALRATASLRWLLNRPWLTDLELSASLDFEDRLDRTHSYESSATPQPAVHATQEGYHLAVMLPTSYYATQCVDSKQLDYAASLKATWVRRWGRLRSHAKAGLAWRADGNVGRGLYYADEALSAADYRPWPFSEVPYMHNLAAYVEELLTLRLGERSSLQLMAGLRAEKTWVRTSRYDRAQSLSPRLNLTFRLDDRLTLRAGWGTTEKLPSFNILYPQPQYLDTRVFSAATSAGQNIYLYHTHPYAVLYNESLRWQRNRNIELGVDLRLGATRLSLAGYFNRTKYPYELVTGYEPFSYRMSTLPATDADGNPYTLPVHPLFKVDEQTGELFVRDADNPASGWVAMQSSSVRRTFARTLCQENRSPVDRAGLELVVDFPQINPLRTQLRLDGAYVHTRYVDDLEAAYYPSVTSGGEFYPYVGLYAGTGGSAVTTWNGRETDRLDLNLTATTHIPAIRLVVTLRLEATLMRRSQNLSEYLGREYAYNVTEEKSPTGGSIYDGGSYTAVRPIYYLDLEGRRHPFTDAEASDPAFASLILRSANTRSYDADGYGPYFSANLSLTKEIGDHVSVSFYANNFTNSRRYVTSRATGVKSIFTPEFYYGLTVRFKF